MWYPRPENFGRAANWGEWFAGNTRNLGKYRENSNGGTISCNILSSGFLIYLNDHHV